MVRGSTVAVELLCKGTFFPNAGDMLQEVLLHAHCRWQAKAKPGLLQGSQRTFMPPRSLLGSAAWQWLGRTRRQGRAGAGQAWGVAKGPQGLSHQLFYKGATSPPRQPGQGFLCLLHVRTHTLMHTHTCSLTRASGRAGGHQQPHVTKPQEGPPRLQNSCELGLGGCLR